MISRETRILWLVLACGIAGAMLVGSGLGPAVGKLPPRAGAIVQGVVTYSGPIPRPERALVHRDRSFCGESVLKHALHVDAESKGVGDVVVSLEGVAQGKSFPEGPPIVIENRDCQFLPRATAGFMGTLEIRNSDPILHNTHIRENSKYGDNVVNVVQPAGVNPIIKEVNQGGLLDVSCDAHPFMHATIHLFSHPYFSVTDKSGHFQITQIPPGTYTFKLWHETLGIQKKTITVPSSGSVNLKVQMNPEV